MPISNSQSYWLIGQIVIPTILHKKSLAFARLGTLLVKSIITIEKKSYINGVLTITAFNSLLRTGMYISFPISDSSMSM
jgi:hypothetical protein